MIKTIYENEKEINYIIVNKKNKNVYFRFKNSYLEVSKPKRISEKYIEEYLTNNFDKFYIKYNEHLKSIPNNDEIILEDKSYKLNIVYNKKFSYEINDNLIIVNTNLSDLNKIKIKIYEKHLEEMLDKINPQLLTVLKNNNIEERKIKLKYYKSKFGSYNKKYNEITLNVILAKVNINYLYYVLMHEYAHTIVFNHSKSFYQTLEKLMPNYKFYDKNMKNISIWL